MKITYLIQRFLPNIGGSELHVYNLAKRLAQKHKVAVFTFGARRKTDWLDGIRIERFPSLVVNWGTGFANLSPSMGEGLLRQGPHADIIHAHCYGFTQTELATRLGKVLRKPVVVTTHYDRGPPASRFAAIKRFVYDSFIGIPALKLANRIIAVTRFEKTTLVHRFRVPSDKISVIPNGVDLSRFSFSPEPESLVRRLGLSGFRVILFVGRLEAKKGVQHLLNAMPAILEVEPKCKLLLAGPDWGYAQELKRLSKSLGIADKTVFTGQLSDADLLRAYAICDLFVLPSLGEATGLTLLEAMACRKPVVATRLGPLREIVEDGTNGVLVSPGDAKGLADAIAQLLSDPELRRRMGDRGRETVQDLDWQKIAEMTEKLYESILQSQ